MTAPQKFIQKIQGNFSPSPFSTLVLKITINHKIVQTKQKIVKYAFERVQFAHKQKFIINLLTV